MIKIKKVRLEDTETQAITAAITNTSFLRRVRSKLKPVHCKAIYAGEVLVWVYDYYDKYEKAPEREILRIYRDRKKSLPSEKAKLIGIYLKQLSNDYKQQSSYNVEYLYDKLLPYIRRRNIELLRSKLGEYLEQDRLDAASEELVKFQSVQVETSGIYNPLSADYIATTFDAASKGIMQLPGALGELIGPLDRGWLVSFTAPEKRGKTWWLIEMAFQALVQNLRVLFVSLEMLPKEIDNRMWKRMTGATEGKNHKVIVPVFDCLANQTGECDREDRSGSVRLLDNEKKVRSRLRGYKSCIVCKDVRGSDYNATFWYEYVRANIYSKQLVLDKAASVEKLLGNNLRVKCFPAYTANSRDIRAVLNELDVNEGFAADVLIVDYNDILAPEPNTYSERGSIDATWKTAKGVAQQKSLLYITVDQSSKITYERDIRLYDTSEDKRKNAHLDVKVAMNRMPQVELDREMPEEIEALRFSVIAHRHKASKTSKEVLVLQQRELGQPLIDCAWYKK